ncbi:MAG: hypothetical protein GY714_03550 [Desulfobacterales bacterium]|nr:hypothetical protein [Desulfobacterales bacterium]
MKMNYLSPKEAIEKVKKNPEKYHKIDKLDYEQAKKDHKIFLGLFNKGKCSICLKHLKSFNKDKPCLHWLLRPKKFKKKHFKILYKEFSYYRISSYIRWAASVDNNKNINDIKIEHPGGKLIDFTAKYQHLTWSISCAKSDYEGHMTTRNGNFPHYHIQIKLNGKLFIRYKDFHVPFHEDDLFLIGLIKEDKDFVKFCGPGVGMEEILGSKEGLDFAIENSEPTDNEKDAAIHMSSLLIANKGESISGDLIADALDESVKTNKTIASVLKEKLDETNANLTTIISPGEGVPKAEQRTGGRGKKQSEQDG